MATATRTFTDEEAVREKVNLMTGIVGASGSGKTVSALEIAHGIQQVAGGDIYMVDTENKRGRHYADMPMFSDPAKRYKFRHVDFRSPFGPLDYLAAYEHCIKQGAKVIITDSMSHEHEGPGGVLEMHEAELARMAGNDYGKRAKMTMLAWGKPKSERRRLLNTMLQMDAMFISCFRAKEKIKMQPGKEPEPQGFMPISGDEFVYEMTQNFLLYPGSKGTPTWKTDQPGEKLIAKMFGQFQPIFAEEKSLSAWHGRQMANWALGAKKPAPASGGTGPAGGAL